MIIDLTSITASMAMHYRRNLFWDKMLLLLHTGNSDIQPSTFLLDQPPAVVISNRMHVSWIAAKMRDL